QGEGMICTQGEDQRSESNELKHESCIVVLETRACQAGEQKYFGGRCGFWWVTQTAEPFSSSSPTDSFTKCVVTYPPRPAHQTGRGRRPGQRINRKSAARATLVEWLTKFGRVQAHQRGASGHRRGHAMRRRRRHAAQWAGGRR